MKHRRPLPIRIIRALAIALGLALVTFVTVCSAVVWFLTPERLTPIIEKVASANLDADVRVGRAELTFWSSFPSIKVEVSDLHVVSRSLASLSDAERRSLPAGADSLLSLKGFSGSLNLLQAAKGRIALNNVLIDAPRVNMLQVNDSVANFNILPPSDPSKPSSPIPYISIHHFAIINSGPISYNSVSDSIHLDLRLHTIDLSDRGLPLYQLTLDTDLDTPLLKEYNLSHARLNLDGDIRWDGDNPYQVDISDLIVRMEGIDVTISTSVDFHDRLCIKALDVDINRLDLDSLRSHAPASMQRDLSRLDTDMKVDINMRLTEPLVFSDSLRFPAMEAHIVVPDCKFHYGDIHFNRFSCAFSASTSAGGLNTAVVDIDHIIINGRALDVDLKGSVSQLFGNPGFDGRLKADIALASLPPSLRALIPGSLSGRFASDTRLKMNLSDLSRHNFHRIYADGAMSLTSLRYTSDDSALLLYTRRADLSFGSSRSFRDSADRRIDSLLIVKVTLDSLNLIQREHHLAVNSFLGAFASSNTRASADTTRVNPFGGTIGFSRLQYYSTHDSVFLHLRDSRGLASFRQFNNDSRLPQIGVSVDIKSVRVVSREFRSSLRESHLAMTAHLRPRRHGNRRRHASGADSLSRMPGSRDSMSRPARRPDSRRLTSAQLDSIGVDLIDFDIDNSLRDILQKWNANGSLHSSKGSLRIANLPLRSRLRNLDATFTSDSVALNSLDLSLGRSDFSISGTIANLRGAMNRRRPQALKLDFDISSDTIHINELVQAATFGSHNPDLLADTAAGDDWDENEIDKLNRDYHTDSITGAVLVPVNLDARLCVAAANVIYSDINFQEFHGDVLIDRGVLQLRDIAARNAAGSVRLSALYAAPTSSDMSLGLGLILEQFHLDRVKTLIPAIDEILPIFNSFSGIINTRLAATVNLLPDMDLDLSTLRAAVNFQGDSLAVVDNPTMRTAAKWLMFKNKRITRIDSIDVNVVVRDNLVNLYPFMVNVDRYKLGIMGHSDMTQNLNYHVAVLKSPIPFKFGINITGSAEHPRIRFGGARLKPSTITRRDAIADTIRVNLVKEMNAVFRRGLKAARLGPLDIKADTLPALPEEPQPVITASDSLMLIEAGLIQAPDSIPQSR